MEFGVCWKERALPLDFTESSILSKKKDGSLFVRPNRRQAFHHCVTDVKPSLPALPHTLLTFTRVFWTHQLRRNQYAVPSSTRPAMWLDSTDPLPKDKEGGKKSWDLEETHWPALLHRKTKQVELTHLPTTLTWICGDLHFILKRVWHQHWVRPADLHLTFLCHFWVQVQRRFRLYCGQINWQVYH